MVYQLGGEHMPRSQNENEVRCLFIISKELHRRLRTVSAFQGLTQQEAIIDALNAYVDHKEGEMRKAFTRTAK